MFQLPFATFMMRNAFEVVPQELEDSAMVDGCGSFGSIDYPTMQAGAVLMAIPCLVLFLILQRNYVRGFMSGALKG